MIRPPNIWMLSAMAVLLNVFSHGHGQTTEETIEDLIYKYQVKGYDFLTQEKNLDSAEYYYTKALDLQIASNGKKTEKAAVILVNLATVFKRKYDYKNSFECSNEAESILKEIDPESIYFGFIYHNIGNYYYRRQDLIEAKRYFEYTLDWFKKLDYYQNEHFYQAFVNYIDLLFKINESELAEELLNNYDIKNLATDNLTLLDYLILYAEVYLRLSQTDKAIENLRQAERILNSKKITKSIYYTTYYYTTLISTLIMVNDFENANEQVQKALAYFETVPENSNDTKSKKANIYYIFSYLKFLQEEYERSLEIADLGLNLFKEVYSQTDLVNKVHILSSIEIITHLNLLKSRTYYKLYEKTYDLSSLLSSYNNYGETIDLLNKQKLAMQNEGSKFLATENLLDVYLEAINIARILYHETSDISHLEASFRFAESSKSFALLSEIRKVEAMQFAGLPENIKEKDEQLTREIQAYEKILYEEENKENPDSMVILNTKDKIFHLRNSYNDLLQTIEHNYANYYNLKYDPHFVTIGEIQNNLKSNQTLVEYVLLDTALITFVIEKDFAKILSQEIDPQFPEECLEFYNVIHKQDFSNGAHKTYRNFVTLGQKFYKILVEPVLKTTDNKNLIVIPDGPITYLPFEAFLTEGADPEYIDYMDLEYLIYDLSIGYSHSSTLLYTERFKTKAPENKVLAFAPHYEDLLDVIDPASWNRQSNPDFLLPLPGVIQEVEKIELMVPSKAFYREEATEKNFKENCSDYNILHLAMHTRMNDNDPMMSNLVFSQTEDTLNDNRLYAYEIYNLQLNATMSVLSSCSSGYGNMMRGEGMMSLARGFIYAGCPSIIMTLWQVSDNSSAELMTSFYKFLRKGKNKQEALRLAKLNYLKGADDLKSNPYFWSGFVGIGDNSPVFRRLNMYYWGFLASGLVMIIAGIQFYSYWQKRKRRTSQD